MVNMEWHEAVSIAAAAFNICFIVGFSIVMALGYSEMRKERRQNTGKNPWHG